MMYNFKMLFLIRFVLLVVVLVVTSNGVKKVESGGVPALFVFGDSIVDGGNNNGLATFAKCNFPPYGKDFPGSTPTGRWSNGKVSPDFLAEELGIKSLLPAYLTPNLSNEELMTGVNFASGGSGYDPVTSSTTQSLALAQELKLFRECVTKLRGAVGEERADSILKDSLYLVEMGNNDIAISYFGGTRKVQYDLPSYLNFLVNQASTFCKELYELGARRMVVLSTIPLGCLPIVRTLNGGLYRNCVPWINEAAEMFNQKLSAELSSLSAILPQARMQFIDIYSPLLNLINNPTNYGFSEASKACCGTGLSETGPMCNKLNAAICPDVSGYVFWDSAHPTERTHKFIASQILKNLTV